MDHKHSLDLFIFAGELSGDRLGAALIDHLEGLKVGGVGGPEMREKSFTPLFRMEQFQVMGFLDVIKHLPRLLWLLWRVKRAILKCNPKCVVLIDYPGFNLKLAEKLRKAGYQGKIVQYVCPSVWAWKKGRIPKMARDFDLLLSLFPFEKECFEQTPLHVEYIGHPLASTIKMREKTRGERLLLSLFPGSRKKEVARNLPIQLEVARRLEREFPKLKLALLVAHDDLLPQIEAHNCEGITLYNRSMGMELMQMSDFAIATSGTVILELALHGVPTAVNYAISPFDEFLATKIFNINLPFYSLPNLIAGREIFPEFYGSNLNADALFRGMKRLIEAKCPQGVLEKYVRGPLERENPGKSAAKAINKLIF